MREAYEGGQDGALVSVAPDARRLLFFEGGYLVGARSELVEDRLGEVIVAEGGVTRVQLEEAMQHIRSGRKLGQILVELGFLKGGQIETYVRRQIIRVASAILTSTSERLTFSTDMAVEAVTLSPISIGDVFLEAAFHLTDIDLYREKLLFDDYVLSQTRDALALASHMRLSTDAAQVLDLVDARNRVRDIVSASPLSEDRTLRLLLALHQAGIVGLKQEEEVPPAAEPAPAVPSEALRFDPFEVELTAVFNDMQCQNHWQVLGLGRNASYGEIEAAYKTLYERFEPAKHAHIAVPEVQEKLSWVRARLKEAFVTLSSKTQARVYDRMVDREKQYEKTKQAWENIGKPAPVPKESRQQVPPQQGQDNRGRPKNPEESKALFIQAKRAYKEQDFWRAIELCRASIELSDENDPERFHLLGKALSENPRWRQDAEQNLKIAQKLKPWEPRYVVSLAKLYEKVGLQARAQRLYEQVRVMDPDFAIREGTEAKKPKDEKAPEDALDTKVV